MTSARMQVGVVTLFPELFGPFLKTSFLGRAVSDGILRVHLEQLREHGLGKHRSVDDTPYGGGSGMVMRPDCTLAGIEAAELALGAGVRPRRILLSPQGRPFDQAAARRLSELGAFVLVCGRYEGFDERLRYFVQEELSVGDFVITGGEAAALCVLEAVVRLLPGVLGNADSTHEESFSPACQGLLEYPQYTRPATFAGYEVPEVLRSGDHRKVEEFRVRASRNRTRARRPELVPPEKRRR
ncbi:MAG TPA: tRNA (guanosine(37)-N1)-methyltransferase TrmD [Polyangiaceae bacterium]